MSPPESKDELRRFLGRITYLSQFIPSYSDKTSLLRDLLKDSAFWCWEEMHEEAFNSLKNEISDKSTLRYFDTNKDITLEVDASLKGLGAAIIQDGKPIAFASKALTETQSRYSNIEREMLAIVFGCERFHTLLYGKCFNVITDHQPLITICNKAIQSAPARLQRMLLRTQCYNLNIHYRPGPQMILADALSRLPNTDNNESVDLDTRVDVIEIDLNTRDICNIAMVNFSVNMQNRLPNETSNDPILNMVKEIVSNGWPESVKKLPENLRPYWSFREDIAIEAGVLFKGKQVIIPESMRAELYYKYYTNLIKGLRKLVV